MFNRFLLAILVLVLYDSLAHVAHSQGQSGFISLDCGLPANSSYTEATTEISYISDVAFVNGGESKSILPEYRVNFQQQGINLRSFPQGIRNCYKINTRKGTKYLIRATFLYGNYDGLNKAPEFDLHLGANFWDTVKFRSVDIDTVKEAIHFPVKNYVRVCLVNTGSGTPFISALELRPLKNTTYQTQTGTSLSLVVRMDIGSTTNSTYRYPYDAFDRLWIPYSSSEWTGLATSQTVQDFIDFQPPTIIMSNAGTPANASAPFRIVLESNDTNVGYYLYTHVAEIQELGANESRSFSINVNGRRLYSPVNPGYLSSSTIYSTTAVTGELKYTFTYEKLENSTLPPIVNAVEIYALVDFSQSETNQDDVDAATNIKSVYGVERNWDGDPCFPAKYLWTGLNCSNDGSSAPRITALDLSSSGLTGEISSYIGNLNMLESLDLSDNSLTGSVPSFLSQLPNLRVLKLEKNKLTGLVPAGLVERSNDGSLSLSLEDNQNLCVSSPCKKKKKKTVVPIVASVGGSLLALVTAAAIFMRVKNKKKQVYLGQRKESFESKKRQFTYSEILTITNNFKRILGKGGFGTVYHGIVDDRTEVAVKMIKVPQSAHNNKSKPQEEDKRKKEQIEEHYQQFQAEAKLLLTVYHGNLTSLVGYCKEGTRMALIYEYMANGDLESHLKGKQGNVLSWETRLQIAIDSAQGLEYLHIGCKPPIIHRDIKPANILITDNFRAKLADFGLSKFFANDDRTHASTIHMAGSHGYMDPDPMNNIWINEKTDVYSFGVVLLQIITSRPAISQTGEDEWTHLSQWVKSMLETGNIKEIVDQKLRGDFAINSVWKAVEIAMACASWTAIDRPNMSQVVIELRECLALELARKNIDHSRVTSSSADSNRSTFSLNMTTEVLRPRAR